MKETLKKVLPKFLRNRIIFLRRRISLHKWERFWTNRAIKYADISKSKQAKSALLLAEGHVIEKGLTMPNRRLEFGKEKVRSLINHCYEWINCYGADEDALRFAVQDLIEYKQLHENNDVKLPNDISENIDNLQMQITTGLNVKSYITTFAKEYFSNCNSFEDLANKRHSVRNFSNVPIDINRVFKAVELAQTAPSACNRQGVKVKIITDKVIKEKVLSIQNGNRGFGQFADKIILLTFEQGACEYEYRSSGYIDVGIFAMNLLYALHVNNICACTLNAHLSIRQMQEMQEIIGYRESEIPVLFIIIGNAPEGKFNIAKSNRLKLNDICTTI